MLSYLRENDRLRKVFIAFFQAVLIIFAFLLAFSLRFDGPIPERYWPVIFSLLPVLVAIKLLIFKRMGLFSGWWRYVSLPDLWILMRANLISSVVFVLFVTFAFRLENVPRSVLVLDGILCFLLMTGVRVATRVFRENGFMERKDGALQQRVVIVGAGGVGQMIVKELRQNPNLNMEVIGFVDEDPQRHHQYFQGVKVLGRFRDLGGILKEMAVDLVIVAQPAISRRELRPLVEFCQTAKVRIKLLPTVGDILNDQVSVRHFRDVQLEDLLGRQPVKLNIERIQEFLTGKRVLITGAGGSIGSEICRQVASFAPDCLILSDIGETPLFHIENELKERYPQIPVSPHLCDIRDRGSLKDVFERSRPEVVFHAAAYKHVPMSEQNPIETVKNNVLGTRNLADTAHICGVSHFVMVSTDKAVNPTNVMGASKRAAEIYVQTLAQKSLMKIVTVRFGNVLGSNGSVVPIFRKQIENGGPVTVTHPEVTRFFMTIPESVQLVLQAGSMGRGGEIFLLDMGKPVKIVHLAEEVIRLSGLKAHHDIDIIFTGLRPGEKLHEELLLAAEGVLPTCHEKIRIARSTTCSAAQVEQQMEKLHLAVRAMDRNLTLHLLRAMVPEYKPASFEEFDVPKSEPAPGGQVAAGELVTAGEPGLGSI